MIKPLIYRFAYYRWFNGKWCFNSYCLDPSYGVRWCELLNKRYPGSYRFMWCVKLLPKSEYKVCY